MSRLPLFALGLVLGSGLLSQTPGANLRVIADSNNSLAIADAGACGTTGPATPLANLLLKVDSNGALVTCGDGGTGDVQGPGSATDNAVARFDGTTGKALQNSVVLIGDTGAITGVLSLVASGDLTARHSLAAGTAPTVANTSANSCGTTAATIAGKDEAFKITVGETSGTSCTVTFGTAFANAPACSVSNETTANLARATSTTTTVIVAGVFVAGDVIAGVCRAY